jgi:squalene-associated FAD-dependent desaturase
VDRLANLDQGLNAGTTPRLTVAVVGGGWAGLAAAVELCTSGAQVVVFEAARQLGGRARSVHPHGEPHHQAHRPTLDNGQHLLLGAYHETLRLMNSVGANPEKRLKRLPLELHYPGASFRLRLPRLPAPLNLAIGLIAARGASLREKIGAARFIGALQRANYRIDDDCPVAEFLDRHGQHGSLRRQLWEALCLAALNTAPERASAQIFANVLRDSLGGSRSDTDLLLPAADLDQLFALPAAAFIRAHHGEIRLSSRVESIDRRGGELSIGGQRFDRVIVALAPQQAAPLLAAHQQSAATAALLSSYSHEPIGTLYAAYPPELRLPFPMLGLGAGGSDALGQWVFDRGQLCGTPGLMAFVLSASGGWEKENSGQLLAALHGELEQALGRPLPPPLWHRLIRERRATFSCRPGLPRPAAATTLSGLWLAGDYCCANYPATLEGAVRSGVAAARGALQCLPASSQAER